MRSLFTDRLTVQVHNEYCCPICSAYEERLHVCRHLWFGTIEKKNNACSRVRQKLFSVCYGLVKPLNKLFSLPLGYWTIRFNEAHYFPILATASCLLKLSRRLRNNKAVYFWMNCVLIGYKCGLTYLAGTWRVLPCWFCEWSECSCVCDKTLRFTVGIHHMYILKKKSVSKTNLQSISPSLAYLIVTPPDRSACFYHHTQTTPTESF